MTELFTVLLILINIILTLSIGYVVRRAAKRCIPPRLYDYADETISTFELSACIFEIGVVGRVFGTASALFCVFSLILAKNYCLLFNGRLANPCCLLQDILVESSPIRHLVLLCLLQFCGAIIAYPYVCLVWKLAQNSQHLVHLEHGFKPNLKIDTLSGFIVELAATFFSNFMYFMTRWRTWLRLPLWFQALATTALGVLLAETTGVWMNPALATAHSFQLQKDHFLPHIFVYCFGPLCGMALAILCESAIVYKVVASNSNIEYNKKEHEL